MSFSKNDLEKIKSKILISAELEKKNKLIKKGKDHWCCCPFHEEKTPSFKINDDQGSFYCFGCGAKGDIISIYTDLYNYTFQDAVKELAQRSGIKIQYQNFEKIEKENLIVKILDLSCDWFQNNLLSSDSIDCQKYLKSRKLSKDTINKFKLGYSFNHKNTLFEFLKEKSFKEDDIIKSNVVKIDKNNKIKDYFYKKLIFPIHNERGSVAGFGGRALDNSNPKYINSPDSDFFHKRQLLYNLSEAKNIARKKNNLLICEGYMDVISLYQNGIKSVVAPLGTALTEEQLNSAWKYSSKPTIMFDGDNAGLRASFKSALMSLPIITSKKFLQFIKLDNGYDPDSFINTFSFNKFLEIIKKPKPLINFIFDESSNSVSLNNADEKISFDRYLDELIETIKDKKIKYFYKSELKTLFFNKIKRNISDPIKFNSLKKIDASLKNKQILSFITGCINNKKFRRELIDELLKLGLLKGNLREFLIELKKPSLIDQDVATILDLIKEDKYTKILKECLDSSIYQLFPYSSAKYENKESFEEITKFANNLNTRLLNLQKINKSLDSFVSDSSQLNWDELQNINVELSEEN